MQRNYLYLAFTCTSLSAVVYRCQLYLTVTFRNALSLKMMTTIGDSLVQAFKEPQTKVIVLKSEGKVFSAGHDLRELVGAGAHHFTCRLLRVLFMCPGLSQIL